VLYGGLTSRPRRQRPRVEPTALFDDCALPGQQWARLRAPNMRRLADVLQAPSFSCSRAHRSAPTAFPTRSSIVGRGDSRAQYCPNWLCDADRRLVANSNARPWRMAAALQVHCSGVQAIKRSRAASRRITPAVPDADGASASWMPAAARERFPPGLRHCSLPARVPTEQVAHR